MRVYEHVTETITRSIAVKFKCDCCGEEQTNRMNSVTMNHNSWGNDSIDSYTTKDYCSDNCYAKLAKDFLEDDNYCYYETSVFDDIEIEKLRVLINYKG